MSSDFFPQAKTIVRRRDDCALFLAKDAGSNRRLYVADETGQLNMTDVAQHYGTGLTLA